MFNPLSFLSQVTVAAVEPVKKPVVKTSKQYQPVDADLRIWNSGAIYPSAALIEEFSLEYARKDAEDKGFGIDIIDIAEMPSIKSPERFIAMSVTPRNLPKIDLFAMTRYDEEGNPVASVATQGSATFGKEYFLPLLKEVYGLEPNEEGFIDLNIMREMPFNSPNGIFRFPKRVSRGEQKGETTYERRENQTVFALVGVVAEKPEEPTPETSEHIEEFEFPAGNNPDEVHAVLADTAAEVADVIEATENPFSETDTPVFTPVSGTPRA